MVSIQRLVPVLCLDRWIAVYSSHNSRGAELDLPTPAHRADLPTQDENATPPPPQMQLPSQAPPISHNCASRHVQIDRAPVRAAYRPPPTSNASTRHATAMVCLAGSSGEGHVTDRTDSTASSPQGSLTVRQAAHHPTGEIIRWLGLRHGAHHVTYRLIRSIHLRQAGHRSRCVRSGSGRSFGLYST